MFYFLIIFYSNTELTYTLLRHISAYEKCMEALFWSSRSVLVSVSSHCYLCTLSLYCRSTICSTLHTLYAWSAPLLIIYYYLVSFPGAFILWRHPYVMLFSIIILTYASQSYALFNIYILLETTRLFSCSRTLSSSLCLETRALKQGSATFPLFLTMRIKHPEYLRSCPHRFVFSSRDIFLKPQKIFL